MFEQLGKKLFNPDSTTDMPIKISPASQKYVKEVAAKAGWSEDEAAKKMQYARLHLGITFEEYCKHRFWKTPEDVQGIRYKRILTAAHKKELEREKKYGRCLAKLIAITGWSYEHALEMYEESHKRTGVVMSEYYFYHFYEMDAETQNEMFIASKSAMLSRRYDSSKESTGLTYNKSKTNMLFNEFLHREWCINNEISEADFVKRFSNSKRLIYKPLKGGQGHGIEAVDILPDSAKEVYQYLAALPKGLIEEYVRQHPVLNSLCSSSVNTIRFATLSSNTKCVTADGKHYDIAYAALRIGGGTSVVDNFHSGGMVAAIDMDTGILITDATDEEGHFFKNHPVSGTAFKGLQIPYFKEAVDMVNKALEMSKIEGYIGWDVAISETGPVLIEVNHNPGPMLLTAPFISQKKGMMHVMRKYLW